MCQGRKKSITGCRQQKMKIFDKNRVENFQTPRVENWSVGICSLYKIIFKACTTNIFWYVQVYVGCILTQ